MDTAAYRSMADLEETHWWYVGRRRVVASVLAGCLAPGRDRRVLDVGCGTGGMLPLLARFGTVEGVEWWPEARTIASQKCPGIRIHEGQLPRDLPVGCWQLVTLFDVLEHLDDPVAALTSLETRMVAGGLLVLTVPAFQFLWSGHDEFSHHRRRYSKAELSSHLEAAGLRLEFASYFNTLVFPAVAAMRLLQRVRPPAGPTNDVTPTNPALNTLLQGLNGVEAKAMQFLPLPFGVSIVAVARKMSDAHS